MSDMDYGVGLAGSDHRRDLDGVKLANCPHCGSGLFARIKNYPWEKDGEPGLVWGYHVLCDASGIQGRPRGCGAASGWAETIDEAIAAWNTRALSTPEAPGTGGAWQDIESAPKDGSTILCYFPLEGLDDSWCRVVPVFYDERYGQNWTFASRAASGFSREYQPTHWQPLPEPPSTPAETQAVEVGRDGVGNDNDGREDSQP